MKLVSKTYCLRRLPLLPGQALGRWAFLPIRPHICADDPATGADHPRAEGWNRRCIVKPIDVHDGAMVADFACDRQRPHAVMAHVGEGHRRAAITSGRHVVNLTGSADIGSGFVSVLWNEEGNGAVWPN